MKVKGSAAVCVFVFQVQVVFCYLQCNNLPEAQIALPHDTDAEDETTHMWDHRQELKKLCVKNIWAENKGIY